MELVAAMGIFFILITMLFIGLAVFFPEWFGITGKKAHEVIAAQKDETSPESDKTSEQKP